MIHFWLSLIMVVVSIPGIILMSVHSSKLLSEKPENESVSKRTLFMLVTLQTLIIVALASASGAYLGPKVGLGDSFIEGIINNEFNMQSLLEQVTWGLVGGIICSLVWMFSYYVIIRPKLDAETVRISEILRNRLGLWTRITSGGIVEEVLFRWGLLSLVAWGLSFIISSPVLVFWLSIVITGLLFGWLHLPANIQEGCKPSVWFVATALLGNLWVSLFCGYLFWQYGILSAFIVHILFHVLWYPLDMRSYKHHLIATRS
ncbi:CPBP family intramembrane glutamic endopeptidase [Paenibacillus lentus]|uniref:CPBP family intramembrane glutamic endopeptidase n=1 Tax=Paenibacillus lentus TaxID=1338368 RepID=UPI0036665922